MASELQTRKHLDLMQSLPLHLAKLTNSIGTTQWPGQPVRYNLPSGFVLSDSDRKEISARLAALREIITGSHLTPNEAAKAKLALLTYMLLGLAGSSLSEAAVRARIDMYQEAFRHPAVGDRRSYQAMGNRRGARSENGHTELHILPRAGDLTQDL